MAGRFVDPNAINDLLVDVAREGHGFRRAAKNSYTHNLVDE
jgi:hypothetical protein